MNLNAVYSGTGSATATTTTLIDNAIALGAADDHKGKWLHPTSGANNSGLFRRVTASAVAANVTTLTFAPALTDAPTSTQTYLLWGWSGEELHPQRIHEFINTAIQEITGLYYDPVESLALHGDGRQGRFDVPAGLAMIRNVMRRSWFESVQIHRADTAWDEAAAPANVTRSVSTEDYKLGGSNRFVVAAGFTTGLLSSKAITSLNLSKYTHVEFWIKSSVATAAGDLQLLLDDTALAVSALETLSVPALVANTWTYVRVALANPRLDTAIISVGLNYTVDIGAATIWINDVKATHNDNAAWSTLNRSTWRADKEARTLVLEYAGIKQAGYSLLKLVGGDEPALLTADSGVTEVPEGFIIARATALALASGIARNSIDAAQRATLLNYWLGMAEREKGKLPPFENVRVVT
jgi:hypothetical protein